MLVLSRKVSEGIQIGEDIRIVVVKVERNGVRLGIEAPNRVPIVREELLIKVEAEVEELAAQATWRADA